MTRIATILALCLTLGACGQPPSETEGSGVDQTKSALLSPLVVNGQIWAYGQVNNTTNKTHYVCANPPLPVYWNMVVTIAQSYSGFTPPPGVVPASWGTVIRPSDAYLASDPSRALSTLDCPPVAMAYSSTYNVIYNTAAVNCTEKGHVPYGPVVSNPVTLPIYDGIQYVPNNLNYGEWRVKYQGPNGPNGSGYCGPAARVFGS